MRTLDVGFADTSADQLRFTLDHSRIAPLASAVVGLDSETGTGLDLELHVIGSSHQVVLHDRGTGTDEFIETFACLGGHPVDHRDGIVPAWGDTSTRYGDWAGFARHDFHALTTEISTDFSAAVAEVIESASRNDVHVVVGFPGNDDAITALTLTENQPGHLSWQTWHCYPQHRQIVSSIGELSAQTPQNSRMRTRGIATRDEITMTSGSES